MQWDKVKNILIAILLTINLFLLGNLAVRGWQSHRRTSELEANLRTLVSARGMQLDTAFSFPEDITLPELSLDRSRADEEKIAAAMLGEHAERTEQEDGTVRFESDRGTLEWQADGNVQADYTLTESAPTSASEALEQARRLCSRWGFQAEQANWTANDMAVTLTGSVAGLPVHNRRLTLDFSAGDGTVSLVGLWSLGTPYTTANGISITCSAADALLQFRLIAVVPYRGQCERWSAILQSKYRELLNQADRAIILSEQYFNGCMLRRNDFMLANTNHIIAFFNGKEQGGTYYTTRKAKAANKQVTNIYK